MSGDAINDLEKSTKLKATAYFVIFSLVGSATFFLPIEFRGKSSIIIDHIVTLLLSEALLVSKIVTMIFIVWGVISPFLDRSWNKNYTSVLLSLIQIAALPLGLMYLAGAGPELLMSPEMLPFLFEKLAMPVGIVIPIGALFLTFLLAYGLLEAVGTLMEPVMKPIFKIPGKSAIDAVASFAGSYSVGLLITSRVYKSGMYSAKEAAIIATGFSTVSATFMLIVAKTLNLVDYWGVFFFSTLAVTFAVTVITVRLPPLRGMNNDSQANSKDSNSSKPLLIEALNKGVSIASKSEPIHKLIYTNVVNGLLMSTRVVPSILAMGMLGLLAAKYTPIFDVLGVVLWPVVWLFEGEQAFEVSSIIASGLAEMFLPALQGGEFGLQTRFVIGSVSIASILFLSASIPCILAAEIPLGLGKMVSIWFLRTIFSIPMAYLITHLVGIS